MSGATILVRGDGIAAACCVHLLRRAGLTVMIERVARPPVPAILLSDPALALIRDVFDRPALFADAPRIDRRVVAWGRAVAPVVVPHGGVVVSEAQLAALSGEGEVGAATTPHFTIDTAAPASTDAVLRFGTRRAAAAPVRLRDAAGRSCCIIEALDDGWLFLIHNPAERTWLLAIGAPLDALLARSRVVAPAIADVGATRDRIDTCPRIARPLVGADWLACGSAAVAFDPICGDGTAQAVREAILAAAVIVAMVEGGDAATLTAHYAAMLVATMRRHLGLCADFYRSGGATAWWQTELAALIEGHGWCTAQLARTPGPRYQLDGFRLIPRKAAA